MTGRPDPYQLPETAGDTRRLTRAERAVVGLATFFATGAVVVFASTLPPGVAFCGGLGWAWVLHRLHVWEQSVNG